MNQTSIQTTFRCHAFRIHQVIFDDSDLVSVSCMARVQNGVQHTTLLFTFSHFNQFLRLSGEAGAKLQQQVCDKLLGNEEPPYLISLEEAPILFVNCALELSYLLTGDESCYSVEGIQSLSFLQQAAQLKQNIRDFGDVHLSREHWLKNTFKDLASIYHYYAGLLELNINEHAAREKAGLLNEKIFKLAYYAAGK